MVNYTKELSGHGKIIREILQENNGKIGITQLIKILKKRINTKAIICRDAIITAGAKGIVVISKNPPNQLLVELPT